MKTVYTNVFRGLKTHYFDRISPKYIRRGVLLLLRRVTAYMLKLSKLKISVYQLINDFTRTQYSFVKKSKNKCLTLVSCQQI